MKPIDGVSSIESLGSPVEKRQSAPAQASLPGDRAQVNNPEAKRLEVGRRLAGVTLSPWAGYAKQTYAQITIDHATDIVVVQIKDANNGELIRQIPAEEWVRLHEDLQVAKGTIVEVER